MSISPSSNKRLAKNTLMLYFRTFIIMCIGMFTSRVILQTLGFDDFGIYNVVGGFVGMFSIVTNSLISTTQRYLTVELGKGKAGDIKRMFGIILAIHVVLILILGIIFESAGLYLLNYYLNIPEDRQVTANIVFQISVFTSLLGLYSTPYIAIIVANERLSAFAFISLQDSILRLIICYALYFCDTDRLILYASMLGLISVWNQFLYVRYCRKHFPEVKTTIVKDKKTTSEVFRFAGMNFIGSAAYILSTEGITVILNIYYGVILNASRAIAIQVQNLVGRFTGDFMTALNPQITKEYASGNKNHSMNLCFRGAKFSYFIVLILAIPISVRASQLLELWLDNFPDYTVPFVRLTLIVSLLGVLSSPLVTINLAVGKIQAISLWIGGLRLLTLPIIYFCFKKFDTPLSAYYVVIAMDLILLFIRLRILDIKTGLPFTHKMIANVLIPVIIVSLVSFVVSLYLNRFFGNEFDGLIFYGLFSILISIGIIILIGLNNNERNLLIGKLKSLKNKFLC